MKKLTWRMKYFAFSTATAGLFFFNGCFLSDQQLTTVWQSVLTTGINTILTNLLTGLVGGDAAGA
jgi:hypothetical protein